MLLRNRLFLILSVMTMVPLLILLFGVVEQEEKELQQRASREIHATLEKMGDEIDALLESQRDLARGLAKMPLVMDFAHSSNKGDVSNYAQKSAVLGQFFREYQLSVSSIQALRFIDPDGKTLVKAKEGKQIEALYYDDRRQRHYVADQSPKRFFQMAMESHAEVVVSDFELGRVTYDSDFCPAMLRYSVPIKDDNRMLGLLVVNMWGERIDNVVEASLGGYPAKAYIVELSNDMAARDGIYLYHADNDKRFANQLGQSYRLSSDIPGEDWQAIRSAERNGSHYMADRRIIFYNKIYPYETRDTSWMLVIETDRDTILAPMAEVRRYIWYLLAILLALSLIIARGVSSKIAKPVHDLAHDITRYADGDTEVRYVDSRQDEIGTAGRAFNYLADRFEHAQSERDKAEKSAMHSERLASLGQLAAGIGHEINNPLQNIMSLSALIEKGISGEKSDELKEDIHLLQQEGRRCARIVQGILNFAKENEPAYSEFDMLTLIEDTLFLLKHRIETANMRLHRHYPDMPDLMMEGDTSLLQQVLVNIVLNAIQASTEGSDISVTVESKNNNVKVMISDSGPGIAEEDIHRVFNPFFTTKNEGDGTGLGLSVSYGIVKKHGGTIQLHNIQPHGVQVTIQLPRYVAKEESIKEIRHVG